MLEKVSEVKVNTALNDGSVSDDGALLEWVDKKKKQNASGESSPSAMMSAQMLVQLLNASRTGGGLQHTTDKIASAATRHASTLPLSGDQKFSLTDRKTLTAELGNALALKLNRSGEGAGRKESARGESFQVKPSAASDAPAPSRESEFSPRSTAIQSAGTSVPRAPDSSTLTPSVTLQSMAASETTSPRLVDKSQRKEESGEVKPVLTSGKSPDITSSVESERQVKSQNAPATLQQLKGQLNAPAVPSAKAMQAVEVDYTFQRWSGDHSVKVSIPVQSLREGNMTLLPSDTRAADALSRNLSHLTGHSPELLQPRQERDEQQKREQQPQPDEEQE